MMLDEPEHVLDAFPTIFRAIQPVATLIIRHELEPDRKVSRIRGELPFEVCHVALLQLEDVA